MELIALSQVYFFQADQKYVTVIHKDGETLIDDTLKELEQQLEGRFVRVHRNALVAIDEIEGLEREAQSGCYELRLKNTAKRPLVSRRHVTELRSLLARL